MLTAATHDAVIPPAERLDRFKLKSLMQEQLAPASVHPAAVLWLLGLFGGCEQAIVPFVRYIKSKYPLTEQTVVDLAMLEDIQKKLKIPEEKEDDNIKRLRHQLGQNLALSLCNGSDTQLYHIVVAVLKKHQNDNELRELTLDDLALLPDVRGKFTHAELSEVMHSRPDLFLISHADNHDTVCRLLIQWWKFSRPWW